MIHQFRSLAWRPVAVALVVTGLGVGGGWLGQGHAFGVAQAQESEPPAGQTVDPAAVKTSRKPTGVVTTIADDRASFAFRTAAGEEQAVRVTPRTVIMGRGDRPYSMELLQVGDYVRMKIPALKGKQSDPAKVAAMAEKQAAKKAEKQAAGQTETTSKKAAKQAVGQTETTTAKKAARQTETKAAKKAAKKAGRVAGSGKKKSNVAAALVARRVIVRPAAEGPFNEGGKLTKGARKSGKPDKKGGLDGGPIE
jgi:hypothetical protein